MGDSLQTTQLQLDVITWADIIAPINCNHFDMINSDAANGFKFRTDKTDATTERSYSANDSYSVLGGPLTLGKDFRFKKGDVIGSALATAGTGPLVITFVR